MCISNKVHMMTYICKNFEQLLESGKALQRR